MHISKTKLLKIGKNTASDATIVLKQQKKAKKDYLEMLNINSVNDNTRFWRTVKPFFTDKNNIILVEDNEIVTDKI